MRKGIGQKTAPLFFGSSRIDETTNHQITAIHLEPCNRAIFLSFEPLSRGTRQRRETVRTVRNKRNETRHTSASRRLPISFSHLLSLCLLRGEILYRPRGSSSRNTSTGRDRQAAGGWGEGKGEGDRGRGVGEDRKCARLPRPHHDHDYDHAGNATMPRRRVCHLIAAARLRFCRFVFPPSNPLSYAHSLFLPLYI